METKTIVQGAPVPLSAQLHDENTEQKVAAYIYDSDFRRIAIVPLIHRGLGLYASLDYLAPDEEYITAQYVVDHVALTDEHDGYTTSSELIYIIPQEVVEPEATTGIVKDVTYHYAEGVVHEA